MISRLGVSLVLALVPLFLVIQPVQAAPKRTVTLAVENMTCAMCPITVRKALGRVEGVKEAKAFLETKTATVTFNPNRTSVKALTQATRNAGYPSELQEGRSDE